MAMPETPLNPRARQDIFEAMAGVDTLPKRPTSADIRRYMEHERMARALKEQEFRQKMDIHPPTLVDLLKCALLPISALTLTFMIAHRLRQGFKNN